MVPKLRFNGFTIPWKQAQIGSILTIGSGRDYKHLAHGEVPVFGTGGLMTYVDEFLHDGETVCIGRKGTIDKPFYYSGKIWTVDTLFFTHSFTKVLPKFVFNLFCNINWKEHNEATGVPSLSKSIIGKIEVFYPDLKEQTKIADFLSSVDEKIALLNKQYDLLCEYKKGMMQKIFSQELRFKDGNGGEFPEWDRKFIGNILTIGSGRDYKHLNDGNVPVFGTGGFMTMVDRFLFEGETVCIGRKGTIDKPFYYSGKIWTVDTLFYTHEFKDSYPKFVYQLFLTINWKEYNEASGVPSLSKNTIEKIEVNIPCLSEQIKIANFLSALDDKIGVKKAELDKLKTWKQGLLQQMFV
ncbi:restriction endonuclease subunit S [Cronobacter dublinensis]|uniref:restriction endonuclease subunit S n=1 Tax=Cronobacter dublinensis TaxID=413497 RepID=UPI000CFC6BA2|nr:restriction endonuclease subunit S [Cronobacter dublinensis]